MLRKRLKLRQRVDERLHLRPLQQGRKLIQQGLHRSGQRFRIKGAERALCGSDGCGERRTGRTERGGDGIGQRLHGLFDDGACLRHDDRRVEGGQRCVRFAKGGTGAGGELRDTLFHRTDGVLGLAQHGRKRRGDGAHVERTEQPFERLACGGENARERLEGVFPQRPGHHRPDGRGEIAKRRAR